LVILPPHDWHHRRSGDVFMYMPRATSSGFVITYAERVTPLRSLVTHVRETLQSDPGFEVEQVFMVARFLTLEGEFGARVLIRGKRHDQPVAHVVAAVFVEDFSTRITARITDLDRVDELVTMVTQLAQHDQLGLGVRRRRRFMFLPPPGWHVVPGIGLEVALFAPEYPRSHACIVVSPAEPISASTRHPKVMLEEQDARQGLPPASEVATRLLDTRTTLLVAEEWTSTRSLAVGRMIRYLAVLHDANFYYMVRLEALEHPGLGAQHQAFIELVGSVESLPSGHQATSAGSSLVWQE